MADNPPGDALTGPHGAISDAAGADRGSRLELLLFGLQSPINIGMILRVAETYKVPVSILDPHGVLADAGKLGTIADFACGALARCGFRRVEGAAAIGPLRAGRRLVATSIENGSTSLTDHTFMAGDIVALGNEYDGLPAGVIAGADVVLRVPMPAGWTPKPKASQPIDPGRAAPVARDGTPNLNVAMTGAIICYAAYADWLARQGAGEAGATQDAGAA